MVSDTGVPRGERLILRPRFRPSLSEDLSFADIQISDAEVIFKIETIHLRAEEMARNGYASFRDIIEAGLQLTDDTLRKELIGRFADKLFIDETNAVCHFDPPRTIGTDMQFSNSVRDNIAKFLTNMIESIEQKTEIVANSTD